NPFELGNRPSAMLNVQSQARKRPKSANSRYFFDQGWAGRRVNPPITDNADLQMSRRASYFSPAANSSSCFSQAREIVANAASRSEPAGKVSAQPAAADGSRKAQR